MFTVFTATFNRCHTLHRPYESLRKQTFKSFEWVIVDDGSTDGTAKLVEAWTRESSFPIRYFYQKNSGKHVAFNRGVRAARGDLFLTFDSDDECVPAALEILLRHWLAIPAAEREQFSAVTGLCVDQEHAIVGDKFPADIIDSDSNEINHRYHIRGDKWGFQRTDVLRVFPFPSCRVKSSFLKGWYGVPSPHGTRHGSSIYPAHLLARGRRPDHEKSRPDQVRRGTRILASERSKLGDQMVLLRPHVVSQISHPLRSILPPPWRFTTAGSSRASGLPARLLWPFVLPFGFLVYLKEKHHTRRPR